MSNQTTIFEADLYEAIALGNQCALERKDKPAIKRFADIQKSIKNGKGDIYSRIPNTDYQFIRLWYMRSLES